MPVEVTASTMEEAMGRTEALDGKRYVKPIDYRMYGLEGRKVRIRMVVGVWLNGVLGSG